MSKIVFHFKKTVYDELSMTKGEAKTFLIQSAGVSEEKAKQIVNEMAGKIINLELDADECDCIDFQEKYEKAEEHLEDVAERFVPPPREETKTDIFPDGIPDAVLQKLKERRVAKK